MKLGEFIEKSFFFDFCGFRFIVKVWRSRPTPAWMKQNFTGIDFSNQVRIADVLIKAGANVNFKSKYNNETPLHSALETGL